MNEDILDDAMREVRRLENVIKTLKKCLIASGVPEGLVTQIATDAYNEFGYPTHR